MKRIWAQFWYALDSESITLFQYILGAAFIAAGVYGVFVADTRPPQTLEVSMSTAHVNIWYWLNIAGPLCCLVGKSLHGDLTYAGRLMQLTGDGVVALVLFGYVSGTVQSETWGTGVYAAFIGAALFCCALLFVARDVRRLLEVEGRVR